MQTRKLFFWQRSFGLLCCLLFTTLCLHAQNGAITGVVKDKLGAVVPGAQVTLTDQERAGVRRMNSTAEGLFLFDSLTPSTYTVTIEAPGFKKWEKRDIKVSASDRIGVTDIVLELGQLTETIIVEASVATLQTESAKVEGLVTSQQVTELTTYNRNFLNMLRTIPGVTNISTSSAGGQLNINGQRNDQITFKLDGTLNMDLGNNSCCSSLPNLDMIQEMKVVTNNATADMGTVGASQIMVVTKSGTKEFHGNVYYFRRHESMNANSWTNNRTGTPRGRDRQNQGGLTLGGPIFIPKVFNTNREKLFFFVSDELWWNLTPSTTTRTVPTALERNGDFSKSVRSDGTAITVLDPTNNRSPFPGNQVPSTMWNADMRKLMNLMPLPTEPEASDTEYTYNFRRPNSSGYNDYLQQSYKVDYNLSEKWRLYARYSRDYTETGNPLGMGSFELDSAGKTLGWTLDWRTAWNAIFNATVILNPTTTNELILSGSRNFSHQWVDKSTYLRKNLGLNFTNLYPAVTRGDYGPQIGFGGSGLSNSPSLGTGRPYHANNPDYQISDNFTKVFTRHTFKAGGVFQIDRKDQDPWGGTTHAGSFNFNRDSQNPWDTDYQFANMLTGAFQTYQQIKRVIEGRFVFHQAEWWVMDTWKATPNLTLDLGLRFSVLQPMYDSKGNQATFAFHLYDPAKAVKLYGYAPGGRAVDPTTGILYPSFLRGAIVVGSGDIDNGFAFYGTKGLPKHMPPYDGIQYAPRIGIAWQPKFMRKTVFRMGAGMFKERLQGNVAFDAVNWPPATRTPTLRYGNVADVSSALYNIYTPPNLSQGGYSGSGKVPKTIQWNFSIQRELPYSTLLTVAYVGSISRHLIYINRRNEPYYGAAWLPENQNPTVTPKYDGTTSLPIDYYRPYRGIGVMGVYGSGSSTNYNSLQVQLEKRMSRKLSYGVAYTWSKALGIGDSQWTWTNPFNRRLYDYGRLSYDRRHVLVMNFVYYLPKFGRNGNFLDIPGVRLVINDWQLSGIITAQTGTPTNFGFGFSTGVSNLAREWTGQENLGPRAIVLQDWKLPEDQMNEYQQFNVNAILPAKKPSVGLESGKQHWSGPATFLASPEIALMKNIPFSEDQRRYVQLRLETFNTLNHHDYTGRAMSATFYSPTELRLTNLPEALGGGGGRFGFGTLTGAMSPRRVQIAAKIYF